MLWDYMQALQGLLRDRNQRTWNPEDLRRYINRARRELAMRTQCIRLVPPISGSVLNIQITAAGSGYTDPIVTISAPDLPRGTPTYPSGATATALATQIGGALSNISVTFGGSGYFAPTVTISDDDGTGGTATATVSPINVLNANQETYNFSDFPISETPGVSSVYAVLGVSILYNNLRYTLLHYSFSQYQAFIRNYPFQYSYVPVAFCQLGQGAGGTLLFYPFPSQTYAFEPDCLCLPSDLIDDQSVEAIPSPWTDAVPYLAAFFAFSEAQSYNNARYWQEQYNGFVSRYSQYARPGLITNPYGRG